MTQEPIERDAVLAEQLRQVVAEPMNGPDEWSALRRATTARAASGLAKRRLWRRMRIALPASAAAGFALFVLVGQGPEDAGTRTAQGGMAGSALTIDELLDANLTDRQFRALAAGAADANELLLIAAGDDQ